jgi:phosphonate transport system substrate-binding protein
MKVESFFLKQFRFTELMFCFLLCSGCKSKTNDYEPEYTVDSTQKKVLIYGVATQAFYELNTPFVNYLNERLDSVNIRLAASSYFLSYVDKVKKRLFDIAGANGIMALENIRNGYSILAASVDEDANAGAIIVNKDSAINNFSDLEGKSIASVGSPTLGHVLTTVYLFKKGLNIYKKSKLKYLESFESVILNVYLGKCSAGLTTINGWHSFVKRRPEIASKVSLNWITPAVAGNPLLIRNTVNKKTAGKIRELILTMHMNEQGRKALARLGYRQYVPADSATYKPFRDLLKQYNELVVDQK